MAVRRDPHNFRPESRKANVSEGRNDRKGYIGEISPNSMFDENPRNTGAHDFRPEARVRNVHEGRNDRKGYIGDISPSSMFAESMAHDHGAHATLEEFAICLVSMFNDVWAAFAAFDTNSNGMLALTEFRSGVIRLGFTVKDSTNIFRELKGSLADVITQNDFSDLWQMGGGSVIETPTRSAPRTTPQEIVDSFGPFLVDDPCVDFARWAQGRWHILFSLFGYKDQKGILVGRQKVRASEFVNFIRGQGFDGNGAKVFAEIQKEGPHYERSQLSEDVQVDGGPDDITMAQLVHFQQRANELLEDMQVEEEGSPANHLIQLLKEKRGCMLRAWRLDLDVHGSGRVAYSDFMKACRELSIASEAKQMWSCFQRAKAAKIKAETKAKSEVRDGPKVSCSVHLELADLDSDEAANVDQFAECLWSNFGFDLDRAWMAIDKGARKMVTLDEWVQGTQNVGFGGDAKLIFNGLSNLGLLYRRDFEYMNALSMSSIRIQHSAMPIKSLQLWMRKQFDGSSDAEGANELLNALGFAEGIPPTPLVRKGQTIEEARLSVSDLSARLTALGYPHDAQQAATIAANGGTDITRDSLRVLLTGKRANYLQSWMQNQIEGSSIAEKANTLLNTLGLSEDAPAKPPVRNEEATICVSELSARLTALGYPHDALQVAMIAARNGHGTNITRESLYTLLVGKRIGSPPRRHSRLLRAASTGQLEKNKPRPDPAKMWRPRKVWRDTVDNISLLNDKKAACVRHYFSVPALKSGFSIADRYGRDAERSPSPNPQARKVQARVDTNLNEAQSSSPSPRKKAASVPESLKDRPVWDDHLKYSSEVNNRISKYVREYFSERERPVKKELNLRRMARKSQIVQQAHGIAKVPTSPPPASSPRFGAPVAGRQAAMQLMATSPDQATPRRNLFATVQKTLA